jgi:hypothetical protein
MTARSKVLGSLVAVDTVGAVVAHRHRVGGEPFGVGGGLDVRNPAVLFFWGSGLSAPVVSLIAAAAAHRHPRVLRVLAVVFGALAEPVFWGRRPCPRSARVLLVAHVGLALILAVLSTAPTPAP